MKGVPLITFDVGGVGEMLHYSEHEDVVVMDSSASSLARKLQGKYLLSPAYMHPCIDCFPSLSFQDR